MQRVQRNREQAEHAAYWRVHPKEKLQGTPFWPSLLLSLSEIRLARASYPLGGWD